MSIDTQGEITPLGFLAPLSDIKLLELGAAQLYVLPRGQKQILETERRPRKASKNYTIGLQIQSILDSRGQTNRLNTR